MYYIKISDVTPMFSPSEYIYIPGDSDYCIYDSQLTQTIDDVGHLEFSVPTNNVNYAKIKPYSFVWVYRDASIMWAGYVKQVDKDMYNNLRVYCVEDYAMFNDFIYYKGATVRYTKRTAITNIINTYNNADYTKTRFTLGTLDANTTSEDAYFFVLDRYDNLYSKLIECKGIDCYIMMEHPNETTRKINIVNANHLGSSSQVVQFGENMLDFVETMDTSEMYNSIYYHGTLSGDETEYSGEAVSTASMSAYGRHDYVLDMKDVRSNVEMEYLAYTFLDEHENPAYIYNLSALDLYDLGADVESINLGNQVHVIAEPYGLDAYYRVSEIVTYLQEPEKNVYTISGTLARTKTLTQIVKGK